RSKAQSLLWATCSITSTGWVSRTQSSSISSMRASCCSRCGEQRKGQTATLEPGNLGPQDTAGLRSLVGLRIMQQIQSIDADSPEQPLFSGTAPPHVERAFTQIHARPVSDSGTSAFC